MTGPRFSLTSGGLACVAAVGAVLVALPAFRHYTGPPPTGALAPAASASVPSDATVAG